MNMMPLGAGMAPGAMPPAQPLPMPSEDQIQQAQLVLDACSWDEISGILRSDDRRNYTIDIETDATAFADEETEKAQRIEFVKAMVEMLLQIGPIAQGNPTVTPFLKELTQFALGAFKAGRALEESLEDAFEQIKTAEPKPDPEAEKLKGEMAMKQQEMQHAGQQLQAEQQAKAQAMQMDMAFKQKEHELKNQQAQSEFALKQQEMAAQLEFKRQELGIKTQELAFKQQAAQHDAQLKERQHARDDQNAEHERGMKERQFAHEAEGAHVERQFQAADLELRAKDNEVKHEDMTERRKLDADVKGGETLQAKRSEIESGVTKQIQELASQFAASMKDLSSNQVEIVTALTEIKANQDDMTDAVTKVVGHMTAPRKVKRDEKGRAIGVDVGESEGGDLRAMLEKLTAGGKQLTRDKDGRVEAFS